MLTVTMIFGPFVAQYVERRDHDALERTLRTATRWAVLIACPVILAIVVIWLKEVPLRNEVETPAPEPAAPAVSPQRAR
jgi:Na+-driven multidrug efflux pump